MEGSKVSGASKEMEIKLLGVARASVKELLGDYCDFLRVRALPIWEKENCQARFVRRLGTKADLSYAANPPARAGFCSRGRAPRTYDSRQAATAERGEAIGHKGYLNL